MECVLPSAKGRIRVWDDNHLAAVVLVAVERALPLFSPGYMHITDEASMRTTWHERWRELDDEFEQYLDNTLPMNPHEPH
ncbi:MAG: hypothetical protein ACRENH_09395 [Gemmatimonadaceae bacterium]